jgi:hypothetical protein
VDTRITRWALRARSGNIPARVFARLIATGLVPPPDVDGLWPATTIGRLDAVMALAPQARSFERRVLLLHQAGYMPALAARRAAASSVVRTIRPGARKMTRVRRELDALADRASLGGPAPRRPRTYALPLAQEKWVEVLDGADDLTWQGEWEMAARYAEILPSVARAAGLPAFAIPDEERIVLALVNLLLKHAEVRTLVPLGRPVSRFAVSRDREETGRYRRTDAPDFDELVPARKDPDR